MEKVANATAHCPLATHCIVVVDDNDDSRRFLEIALSTAGAMVETFPSIEMVSAALPSLKADLFILDLALSKGTGIELLHMLRNCDHPRIRAVPAICLSAHAGPMVESQALRAGFDRFLTKPIAIRDLVEESERLLSSRVSFSEDRS